VWQWRCPARPIAGLHLTFTILTQITDLQRDTTSHITPDPLVITVEHQSGAGSFARLKKVFEKNSKIFPHYQRVTAEVTKILHEKWRFFAKIW